MATVSIPHTDVVAKLVAGGSPNLAELSDDELLSNTRRLVGKTNQLLAALLEHLAEVEARGVHRTRRCASLYTYCIYELRFSEDAAARRSAAARFAREFPVLLHAVAAGELHLTGLLMIGPHLTPENHESVLARAKFRTKKELTRLVRELNPLPEVPDRIEPLGPALARVSVTNPTWEKMVMSRSPQIRELPQGQRPSDWANDGMAANVEGEAGTMGADEALPEDDALPVGPASSDLPPITGPQHFQVQFGTVEEHVLLIERAKALLARTRPGVTLGELHLEAMKLLVATLEKQKFALTQRPQSPRQRVDIADETSQESAAPRQVVDVPKVVEHADAPRSRYVPAAVRREVYRRDGARCTYVDPRGHRCCETRYLELHHLLPFAKNGAHSASNLAVRCAAHNALAAEEDFGTELMAARRHSTRHETLASQARVRTVPKLPCIRSK